MLLLWMLGCLSLPVSDRPAGQGEPADTGSDTDTDTAAPGEDTAAVLSQLAAASVAITSPSHGYDTATGDSAADFAGIAAGAQALAWEIRQPGAAAHGTGSLQPGERWAVEDVPLLSGDNTFTITATDADGLTQTDRLTVTRGAGALASGLMLSRSGVLIGSETEVVARVRAAEGASLDEIALGPVGEDGALEEVWATMQADPSQPGDYTAVLSVSPERAGAWALRAVATGSSGEESPTPAVALERLAPLDAETFDTERALWAAADARWRAGDADGAVALLLDEPTVVGVLRGADGQLSWRGSAGVSWLHTHQGASRRARADGPSAPPDGLPLTEGQDAAVLAPYFSTDFAGSDESEQIVEMMQGLSCPELSVSFKRDGQITSLEDYNQALRASLVHISSHGILATLVRGDGTDGPVVGFLDTGLPIESHEMINALRGTGDIAGSETVMLSPSYFYHLGAAEPFPDNMIFFSSCGGAGNSTLAQALTSAGAGAVISFTDEVDSPYAQRNALAFWERFLTRASATTAAEALDDTPDDAKTPAVPALVTRDGDLVLRASTQLEDFSAPEDWIIGGNGEVSFTTLSTEFEAMEPATAHLAIAPPSSTAATLQHEVCPADAETLTIRFWWQVLAQPYGSWSRDHDNLLTLAAVRDDGTASPIWQVGWGEVAALADTDLPRASTGSQYAEVTLQADTSTTALRWVITGWDADLWEAAIDDIEVNYE